MNFRDDDHDHSINLVGLDDDLISIIGPERGLTEIMAEIRSDPEVFQQYMELSNPLRQEVLSFCAGTRGVKMTYDPFFKFIFDPCVDPERLERFLSCCMAQPVTIVEVIPNESRRFTEDSSLLIMDIVVRLHSGALVNVEIQRVGYFFPGARCACYSSDLMMRQYSQIRAKHRKKGTRFSYKDIKTVYTIVLMQKRTNEFHMLPNHYLHYGKVKFNTGLDLDLLQEYLLIPLDIFLKIPHNNISELDAWLYFISSDNVGDIMRVIKAQPKFEELYREVFQFRFRIKELVGMFSEALRILDANTVQYMIEEQQKELEKMRLEARARDEQLSQAESQLAHTSDQLSQAESQLAHTSDQLSQAESQLAEKDLEIQRLKALLAGKS